MRKFLAFGLLPLLLAGSVQAGPLEARALWDAARATAHRPWPERVAALRRVLDASHPTDSVHARALAALATVLQEAGHVHAAWAFRARAVRLGPRRHRRRIDAALALAKALRREMDLEAARTVLEAVAEDGRRVAPRSATQALDLLARDAFDQQDVPTLERIHARLERERAPPHLRLATHGYLGLMRLGLGDRDRAERHCRDARRLYEAAMRSDSDDALRCARLWLDFPLRAALAGEGGG